MVKRLIQTLHKKDIQKSNKKCSILLLIGEITIKSTVRYHYTHTRTAKMKKASVPSVGQDVADQNSIHCE